MGSDRPSYDVGDVIWSMIYVYCIYGGYNIEMVIYDVAWRT